MKTSNKLALLAAFGTALAGVSVLAQPGPAEPAAPERLPGPPHNRFAQVLQGVIRVYDVNKDGQLDSTEMAALDQAALEGKIEAPGAAAGRERGFRGPPGQLPKEILDQYDADHDGALNDTERAAMRQAIQSGQLPPPENGRPPRGPIHGPITAQQILDRFDLDKDGKLDSAELTAFLDSRPGAGPGPAHRRGGGPPFGGSSEGR